MNFIEAVKEIEKNCDAYMFRVSHFDNKLNLVNDVLCYVKEKVYYDGTEEEYVPTSKDMLANDWVVETDQIIDGVRLNSMIGYKIVKVKHSDNEFTITLSNDTKYIFSVNNIEGSATIFKV